MLTSQNIYLFINIFIIALYIVLMIIGYNKGFLYQIVNMLYTIASLAIAWFASPVLAKLFPIISIEKIDSQYKLLNTIFNLDNILNTAAYFIIVFLVLKVIYIFLSLITKSLNKIPVLGKLNKVLGMLVGIINATIIVLALSMLLSLPIFKNAKEIRENTLLKYISKYSNQAISFIAEKIIVSNDLINIDGFDIDSYRQEFSNWLQSLNNNE